MREGDAWASRSLLRQMDSYAEGSMEKLFCSEMYQRMLEIPMSMSGAYGMLDSGDPLAPAGGRWPHLFMYSRGRTIAAGTSEVQRGIIAQRVLGLPKDR